MWGGGDKHTRPLPTAGCPPRRADASRAVTGNMGACESDPGPALGEWHLHVCIRPLPPLLLSLPAADSPWQPGTPMSSMLDVMGMSHQGGFQVDTWHSQEPAKPLVMTECCRCGDGGRGGGSGTRLKEANVSRCEIWCAPLPPHLQLRDAAGRGCRPAA